MALLTVPLIDSIAVPVIEPIDDRLPPTPSFIFPHDSLVLVSTLEFASETLPVIFPHSSPAFVFRLSHILPSLSLIFPHISDVFSFIPSHFSTTQSLSFPAASLILSQFKTIKATAAIIAAIIAPFGLNITVPILPSIGPILEISPLAAGINLVNNPPICVIPPLTPGAVSVIPFGSNPNACPTFVTRSFIFSFRLNP